jgi:hypothetical protein
VIYNVVIHINNEQPLLADLFDMPTSVDAGLRCTNLRQLNGKRPIFVDDQHSVFFFSYEHIRFVEIPPASLTNEADRPMPVGSRVRGELEAGNGHSAEPELDLEIDEDFLRRIREV